MQLQGGDQNQGDFKVWDEGSKGGWQGTQLTDIKQVETQIEFKMFKRYQKLFCFQPK